MKKRLAAVTLAAMLLRIALLAGGEQAGQWLREKLGSGPINASLNVTFGEDGTVEDTPSPEPQPLSADTGQEPSPSPSPSPSPQPVFTEDENILETTISGGLTINNATGYDIDIQALLSEGVSLTLPSEGPQILIVHTHGSEAYTPDPENIYEESGSVRTEDTNYNVVRVGDELAAAFEAQGLSVIHDRGIYDYPSYTGSYSRSGAAVESYLAQYPGIAIVIDLHRDALCDGDVVYKTVAHEGGEASSQLMLLVGTGENGLYHPYWRENLKLALTLQNAVAGTYPSLARPVAVKQERYNQQLTTGSLILEVGSSGNTLPEALAAVRLFAEAAGPALLDMVG